MTHDEVLSILELIAADRPRFDTSRERVDLWHQAFGHLEAKQVSKAALRALERVKGMIGIAHVMSEVHALDASGPSDDATNPRTHFDGEPRYRDRFGEGGDPLHVPPIPPAPVFKNSHERADWRRLNGYYDHATPFQKGLFVRTPPGPALPTPPPELEFIHRFGAFELHLKSEYSFQKSGDWKHSPWPMQQASL